VVRQNENVPIRRKLAGVMLLPTVCATGSSDNLSECRQAIRRLFPFDDVDRLRGIGGKKHRQAEGGLGTLSCSSISFVVDPVLPTHVFRSVGVIRETELAQEW